MILVTKIEQHEFNQKLFQNIIDSNLKNKLISNIVVFTDSNYLSNNNRIIVFNKISTESSHTEKVISLFPNQIICWSLWNQIFNYNLAKYNKIQDKETFFKLSNGEYEFIIFNPHNFIKKYTEVIDCIIGKKIDISHEKISESFKITSNLNKPSINTVKSETTRVKGQRYTNKLVETEVRKIDTIIVSVDYNDTLILCLEHNRKYLKNITVVTSEIDYKCQEICKKFEVRCLVTNCMFENEKGFNKGKAINEAINTLNDPDWILLLDADILLIEDFNVEKLERDTIYTSSRHICQDYNEVDKFIRNEIPIDFLGEKEKDHGYGFFHLFNINSPNVSKCNPYSEIYTEGTFFHQDIEFKKLFQKNITITNCIHLGRKSKNWRGRKSPKFIDEDLISKKMLEIEKKQTPLIKEVRSKIDSKLAVITTFFNPKSYINIKYNYSIFSKKIKEKADLFTIELSFDGEFYCNDKNTIKINGNKNNVLWQKERLLNILLEKIPKEYTNIAWIDCDILFNNPNWVEECNKKLENCKVVQLYEFADRLNEKDEVGSISRGIISRISEIKKVDLNISLGIPGFAWAARREVLEEIGFLDTQIIGGGDSLMCNSFLGNNNTGIVNQMNESWKKHYIDWSNKAIQVVNKSVDFVSGRITHLYHGQMSNRKYNERYNILTKYDFNPEFDLNKDENGLWTLKNKMIEEELSQYFEERDEDDNIIDINTYFDKVFVINLDRRADKLEKVDSKLKKMKIQYERFSAVDGNNLRFDNSKFIPGKGMIENKFALGCLLSHLEIIKIAKEKNYKRILIFEDDVLISENINISIQKLRNIKEWKLLYFGTSQYDWNIEMYNEDFYLSKKCLGTFAYAIDSSIYDEIIDILRFPTKSIDNILSDLQIQHYRKCFTFYPNICIADVSESEIREGRDNTKHSSIMRWNLINYV
jgi:GR25 family glycosyltransferase involved in LPS biosynthesis